MLPKENESVPQHPGGSQKAESAYPPSPSPPVPNNFSSEKWPEEKDQERDSRYNLPPPVPPAQSDRDRERDHERIPEREPHREEEREEERRRKEEEERKRDDGPPPVPKDPSVVPGTEPPKTPKEVVQAGSEANTALMELIK